jgi:CubicO group peptidase (beta-lactamase class C family)
MTDRMDRRRFAAVLMAPIAAGALPVLRLPVRGRPSTGGAVTPAIRPLSAEFLARLPQLMEVAGVPGIGMCVVQDGRVVSRHYHGVTAAQGGRPVSADTLWVAASLGKPVFALAALRLVDEGRLALDRPLKGYLPEYAPADPRGDRITARHVLTHSSGLPNWRERDDQPLAPDFEPGTRFRYSGEGYYYLQRVIERVAGTGFEQFMRERLFAPLGMASSTYAWRPDVAARLVMGHDRNGGQWPIFWQRQALQLLQVAEQRNRPLASFTGEDVRAAMGGMTPAPPDRPEFMVPNAASSLLTTPADYGAYLVTLLNGGPAAVALKDETRRAMLTPQVRLNSALAWGLGWGIEQEPVRPAAGGGKRDTASEYLWHWGDNGSWKNFVLVHPASRSALVMFTNGARGLNLAQRVTSAATGRDHASFLWL